MLTVALDRVSAQLDNIIEWESAAQAVRQANIVDDGTIFTRAAQFDKGIDDEYRVYVATVTNGTVIKLTFQSSVNDRTTFSSVIMEEENDGKYNIFHVTAVQDDGTIKFAKTRNAANPQKLARAFMPTTNYISVHGILPTTLSKITFIYLEEQIGGHRKKKSLKGGGYARIAKLTNYSSQIKNISTDLRTMGGAPTGTM